MEKIINKNVPETIAKNLKWTEMKPFTYMSPGNERVNIDKR